MSLLAQKFHSAAYRARPWLISDWALSLFENKVNFFIIEYTGTVFPASVEGGGVQVSVHSGHGRLQGVARAFDVRRLRQRTRFNFTVSTAAATKRFAAFRVLHIQRALA